MLLIAKKAFNLHLQINTNTFFSMISRRILRIKVMQSLYAYFKHEGASTINQAEKELLFSINKAYDLYHFLLSLPVDVANYAESRIELAKNKKLPTEADLNPNSRFIENKLVHLLRINNQLIRYLETKKLNWANNPELIKALFLDLVNSDAYKDYMESEEQNFSKDKSIISFFFKNIIPQQENLYNVLEEQSIYWNDEIDFIIGIILKTASKFKESHNEDASLLPLYKNKEDGDFARLLFRKSVLNHKEYHELIEKFCKNWDIERVAFMDILLMQMAIAEVLEFTSIPTKVTFNEYIELSKYYSTNKSNVFINGILDKIFEHLKKEGKIKKQGRGLIGEL